MRTMTYGAILCKGEKWYTDLGTVFSAFEEILLNNNWLITDWETTLDIPELDKLSSHEGYILLSGDELAEILKNNSGTQWVWGVLSAFDKKVALDEILKYPLPFADGYDGFWVNPLTLQHPLAIAEIVPWDSALVLVLSKDSETVHRFRERFPLSEDLAEYNMAHYLGAK